MDAMTYDDYIAAAALRLRYACALATDPPAAAQCIRETIGSLQLALDAIAVRGAV